MYDNDDNGSFKAEDFVSTGAKCQDQSEDLLIAAFGQAAKIEEEGSSLTFKDADGKITVVLSSSDNVLPLVLPNDRVYISGAYELKVEGFEGTDVKATFNDESIIIDGCDSHIIPYSAFKNGGIQFGEGESTSRLCADGRDS